MRDAFGGVVNLAMIVIFLVLVTGYLAFNVNYTKAFRVKNYIITKFEQYEGNCGTNTTCNDEIQSYMKTVGYHQPSDIKVDGFNCDAGYCFKEFEVKRDSGSVKENNEQKYYRVVTQIIIDIPIVNKIMPNLKIFQIAGDTKLITVFE